jgi:hypothetical protein
MSRGVYDPASEVPAGGWWWPGGWIEALLVAVVNVEKSSHDGPKTPRMDPITKRAASMSPLALSRTIAEDFMYEWIRYFLLEF